MLPNYKQGQFVIKRETNREGDVLANNVTRDALFHHFHQKPFQDVTAMLRKKTVMDDDEAYGKMTPFSDWLKEGNRRISVRENKIRYSKIGKGKVTFRIARTTGLTQPGLRREEFPIHLNTSVFKPGDKIRPVDAFMLGLVVQTLPRPVGAGVYEYNVRLLDPGKSAFFPTAYLREGVKFCKFGSSNYSEGSLDWGSTLWTKGHSVLTWEVGLFKTGKELNITDEAIRHVFTIDACDEKGNLLPDLPRTFLTEAELNMVREAEFEMEQDLIWGQYNPTIPDPTTRKVRRTGAGIFDFIKAGHVKDYSTSNFSIRQLSDFQESVWFNTAGGIQVYGTGKMGLEQAHLSIQEEWGEKAVIDNVDRWIERTGQIVQGGAAAWKLKSNMFKAYETPFGGTIVFEHWPWLDSRDYDGIKHPKTGKPVLSYHYIASRYQGQGINSNVVLVSRENSEIWGYQAGAVGPYGPINDKSGGKYVMTHGGRFATLRHGNEYGLFVEDVNDFIWFRPNIK